MYPGFHLMYDDFIQYIVYQNVHDIYVINFMTFIDDIDVEPMIDKLL